MRETGITDGGERRGRITGLLTCRRKAEADSSPPKKTMPRCTERWMGGLRQRTVPNMCFFPGLACTAVGVMGPLIGCRCHATVPACRAVYTWQQRPALLSPSASPTTIDYCYSSSCSRRGVQQAVRYCTNCQVGWRPSPVPVTGSCRSLLPAGPARGHRPVAAFYVSFGADGLAHCM